MAWSRQQNPTGYAMPATTPIAYPTQTPTDLTARAILAARSRAAIVDRSGLPPIAANSVKAEGFGSPAATSVVI